MTAFAAALDLLFADPNLGQEAWHRDSEGQFTRIRIIPRQKDAVAEFGAARLWSETTRVDVRVTEVVQPRPGDRIARCASIVLLQGVEYATFE